MSKIFVDTSGWASLADASELFNQQAREVYHTAIRNHRRFVTTNYVLAELVALMTNPLRFPRPRTIEFIDGIKQSPFFDIIHIDGNIDATAWELLTNRTDKTWSLIDCASFVIMNETGITDALTTDQHFEQAGFVRLLK